jgi:thiamine pyrophosphate-dependent acetolactate synthase large subunit-like protein
MHPVEAMLIITRAKNKIGKYYAVDYSLVKDSGLALTSITKDAEGKPLFCKVLKEDFIRYMEQKHNLHKKRTDLSVLRSSLRKS